MKYKTEYEDICKAGFQGTYEDYLDYRAHYGNDVGNAVSKDKEHLLFIYNRLVHKHDENENYDYMLRFKEIIDCMN